MQLQKSLEQYQKIPKYVMVQHVGVGAGKFLRVRKIFLELSQTYLKIIHKKVTSRKSSSSCFGRRWALFLLIFSGVCSDFQRFCEVFQILFPRFPRVFTKSKPLGVRLQPCLLHQWSSIKSECY